MKSNFSFAPDNSLLVIDGDWLAYKIAAAIEKRTIHVFDLQGNFVSEYKTRTKYKESGNYNSNFEIKDSQTLSKTYKKNISFLADKEIKIFKEKTSCKNVLIALGGKTNFRDDLSLPQKYKGSRVNTLRPVALKEVREYLAQTYNSVFSENEEADDIISKYQFRSFKEPQQRIVVCTLDKDARGTPGLLYNPEKDMLVNINGLGFLHLEMKQTLTGVKKGYKLYGEGRKWFYSQLLTGDKADDYYPCDIYKKLIGNQSKSPLITDLKCFNILNPCTTDAQCWIAIASVYREWYANVTSWLDWKNNTIQGNWIDILQMYVDVVHMRRYEEDKIDVKQLLTNYRII